MAKMVLSPLVTSMRGKVGNGITQVWKGIQIIRQIPAVISQPESAAQVLARNTFAVAFAAWEALNNATKLAWEEMAAQVAGYPLAPGGINNIVPKLGGQMSGFNCFMSFASAAIDIGGAPPTPPPLTEARPTAPTAVTAVFTTPNLVVTWTDPTTAEVGAYVRLWLRSKKGIYHRQFVNSYALAVMASGNITGARAAQGATIAFTVPVNDRLYVQMDTVNPSGLRSMGSNVATVGL